MAEIENFQRQVNEVGKALNDLKTKITDVLNSAKSMDQEFQENANSQETVSKRIKKVNDNMDILARTEREVQKITEQTSNIIAKARAERTKENKTLVAARQARANQNKDLKKSLELRKLESGQLKESIKQTERLREARRKASIEARKELGIRRRSTDLFRRATTALLGMAAAYLSVQAATRLLRNSVKVISGFSKAMDEVSAITGATDEQFTQLRQDALRLGASTSKTASEVSGLQKEFAKLGFSSNEIINATEATIDLSIAAGADLAESAVVAASTIRGFGKDASDTQMVVDVMAKSFTSSALDLEKFKTGMAAVAPVAKSAGVSLERTTANLSVLADAGLDASTSGTSLRNIYLELANKGLTWNEALDMINNSVDRNVTALELFGKRGATSALILADNIEKSDMLTKSYENSAGAANKMADVMEDNLQGDVDKLSSAWEGLVLTFSQGEGFMRRIVQGFTRLLNVITRIRKQKLGDELEEENIQIKLQNTEVNNLFRALKDENATRDVKARLVEEINTKYGDYLDNLLTEESSLKDIEAAQSAVNKQMRMTIITKALQEDLTKIIEEERQAIENIVTIQTDRIKQENDINNLLGERTAAENQLADVSKNLGDIFIQSNQQTIDATKERETDTKEKYKLIAQYYNIAWQEIENALTGIQEKEREVFDGDGAGSAESVKENVNKRIAAIELEAEKRINIQKKLLSEREINATQFAARILEIQIDTTEKQLEIAGLEEKQREGIYSRLLDLRIKFNEEEDRLQLDALTKIEESRNLALENAKRSQEELTEKHKEELDKRIEAEKEAQMVLIDLANNALDITSSIFANETANLEIEKNYQLELAGDNIRKRESIEEEFAKKEAEIKRKQAIADKIGAIFNAGINTATAITAMLDQPPPLNFILAALVGALGAVQIGVIASKPIPQFKHGVEDFEGGRAVVGEAGRELLLTPLGTYLSPDKASEVNLPPDTTVIPNYRTEQIIQGGASFEKWDELIFETRKTRDAIIKRPIKQTIIDRHGWRKMHIHNNSRTIWEDTYIRS